MLKRFLLVAFALLVPGSHPLGLDSPWGLTPRFAQSPPAPAAQSQAAPLLTTGPAVQALTSPEKTAITDTLERYFKGFSTFDPGLMSLVLHADAVVTGGVGQASLEITPFSGMLAQFRQLRGKMTPPTMNVARTMTDLFLRGNVATAFVHSKILPPTRGAGVAIDDTFQLYKAGGGWTIVSFVTHAGQYEGETDAKTLDVMGVQPGMTIGEIGAGDGRVTLALARRVGDGGKVYANDIDPKPLAELRAVCERKGTKNIETLVGRVDDPMFPKGALDLAVMAIVYHHLEQPVALLKNLAPALKPGATLVIVDPAYDRTGDKDSDRPTTRERVESEAGQAGYELVAMDASLPRDNIFILRVKTGGPAAVPKVTTTPWVPSNQGNERAAIIATIDTWWKAHDTDDAALFEKVMAPNTRSWFEHEGTFQFISYAKEIERIKSGNRRPTMRPLPGEHRAVMDFRQESGVAVVTMLVEIPRNGTTSRSYTTFQLYKADDEWLIVNMAGA